MIKSTLLAAAMATALASPLGLAATELEDLRTLCLEQERQIRLLEEENLRLRALAGETQLLESTPAPKPSSFIAAATPAPATATRESTASPSFYIVKQGDSLARIARQTGSTPATLARLNGLKDPGRIKPGQKLKLPDSQVAGNSSPAAPTPAATSSSRATTADGRTHTIRQGDTFFGIARQYGLSMEALVAANPEVKPSALRPGQTVRLGTGSTGSARTAAPTSTTQTAIPASVTAQSASGPPAPPAATLTASTTSSAEPEIRTITTDGQMTYGEFARKHGSSVERLNILNALSLDASTILAKGSELYVPTLP